MRIDFDMISLSGLSDEEAAERLRKEGYNELPSSKKSSTFSIIFDVAKEPMFLLLIAGGGIYLSLGDIHEALMLLGFVFIVMGITFYQERKTERALEALRDMTSPRSLVIRGGSQKRIAGREVVRGDIIVLSEGDRIPADAALLSCVNLSVDESLLTGESVPVRKCVSEGPFGRSRPGRDDSSFVFSGTLVVGGFGIAETHATGIKTSIGKIGISLRKIEQEMTLLQKETGKVVRNLAIIGLSLCLVIVVAYRLTRGNWLNGFLAGITLAMAVLPEEFPVILTVFLALGAWRISQKQVLTRRIPVIETLGSASVLCVDKTGTLTLNQMSVQKICSGGSFFDVTKSKDTLPDDLHETVEFGILASQVNPFDPMEKALRDLGDKTLRKTEHLHDNWALVEEYPLSPSLLAMSRVWKAPGEDSYIIAAKGSPEAVADICHFNEEQRQSLMAKVNAMAKDGLRVIAVAGSAFMEESLPPEQHDFAFTFKGLIGFADPVRSGVSEAIRECYTAGIRVIMITGDYPITAQNVASQIGFKDHEEIMTGSELEKICPSELQQRIKKINIFARVDPGQKLLIVNALKANGEIVAMTGDGVNDAPSLKAAHIGIAMGGRGTDVAREASAMVLLDDDFSSIVGAIRMGRRIFDNLKKAMAYTLAIHVPIAGMSLLPVLFIWPLVLLPVHIVFLELIIDPACSVVFEAEAEETAIMNRPPRELEAPLFDRSMITFGVLQGIVVFLFVLSVYVIALYRGQGASDARTLCFTTLIVANLGLILTNRSWSKGILNTFRSPNNALWWVLGAAVGFLVAVLYVPFFRELFRFSTLHAVDLLICLSAGIMSIFWFEAVKTFRGKKAVDAGQ